MSPAFGAAVDSLTSLPGDPLVSASIAVTLIAGLTGSASGGLDSLPHNGYVVTTIRGVCRETHKSAYWPMFCMTVLVPIFGLIVALLLL